MGEAPGIKIGVFLFVICPFERSTWNNSGMNVDIFLNLQNLFLTTLPA